MFQTVIKANFYKKYRWPTISVILVDNDSVIV